MADILGIGTSGLLAYQRALTTTSHNISNVNTEGYSRQRTGLGTQIPEFIGVGYAGTGVRVTDISRNFDNFLVTQLREQTANYERYNNFNALASQIDNMLADQNAGLGPMMDEFFASVQGVADNPNSIPARQVMMTSAESLADRFHFLDNRLRDLNEQVNQKLHAGVYEVNTIAQGIAQLNEEIALARGAAAGGEPNDLLDRRDHLITKLAELVDVKTVEQKDGMMNVFIGSGQGLVVGKSTLDLRVQYDDLVQGKTTVVLDDGGKGVDISRLIKGGSLGGTLEFSNSILDESRNALGRIAAGISEQFNELHQLGIDLTGQLGGDFFKSFNPAVFVPSGNSSDAKLAVSYDDVSQLTTRDYQLRFNGTNWQLSDYKTGKQLATAGPGQEMVIDGLRIDLSSVPNVRDDRYLIRPTSEAARWFDTAIEDPERIAAAGAIQGSEWVNAQGMPSNVGTGKIDNVTALDPTYLPLGDDITISFNGTGFPWTDTIDLALYDVGALNANEGLAIDWAAGTADFTGGGTFRGINIQDIGNGPWDLDGVSFTIDGTPIELSGQYAEGDLAGVASHINGVLAAEGLTDYSVETHQGQLVFSQDGSEDAIAIGSVSAAARNVGFVNSAGESGGAEVRFTVDGHEVLLNGDYADVADEIQSQLNAIAGNDYAVSLAGGQLTITNNTEGTGDVVVAGQGAGAMLSGFFEQREPEALNQLSFSGIEPVPAPIDYNPNTDGGATYKLLHNTVDDSYRVIKYASDDDIGDDEVAMLSFTFNGIPDDGDAFVLSDNPNAVGDNRNALALAALQTDKGMIGGTATYQSTYGQMVSRVGTQAHQASINKDATHTLRTQAEQAVQSVSGVNLDEEAANMIKYQQAYQANAQMISVANQLFQTLLGAF